MHNRKVLKTATEGLTKAKALAKPKDIIRDPLGQWKYPGQNTRIPASNITMKGVNYPVLGQPNVGQPQMMYPGQEYQFPGADYVDEFPQGNSDDYIDAELTDEEIEQYRKSGYIIEDVSVPQLTQAQFGQTVSVADQNEYNKRLEYYNLSKNLQNYINTKVNIPKNYRRWVSENDVLKGDNLDYDGWSPEIYTKGQKGYMNQSGYINIRDYRKDPNFFYDIKPDAWYHTGQMKGDSLTSKGYGVPIVYPYWFNPVLEREPLPEIGTLPSRIPVRETPEIVPQTFKYTPKKQEPIQVANRSQTIMEPDPNRPGKYRMKELRQVPYSAKFPGEAKWEPANAPGVMWINSEGQEVEIDPRKTTAAPIIIKQKEGGYIADETYYPPKHNPANSFAVNDPRSMQEGGNYFSYKGRPDAKYMKKNDGWYINAPGTNQQYIKVKDPTGSRTKLLNEQAVYHSGTKAKPAFSSIMGNVTDAFQNVINPINSDILKIGESVSGGGYNKAFAGSGTPFVISHNGQEILPAATDGTYCSGYTCGVSMKVLQQRGLLDNMTPDQLKNFQKTWYGAKDFEKGKSETLSTKALEDYNLGKRIEHKAAKPGDIAQIWRNNGSGHSVIFKDWVTDDKGNRIGIKYRSSQPNTKGIGDRTEIFGTKIDPNRIYVARLNNRSEGGESDNNYIEVDADDNDIANYIAQGYQVKELPKAQYAGQTPFVHPDAGATNVLFQKPAKQIPNSKYNLKAPVNYQAKLKPVTADNTKDVTANQAVTAKQVNDYMATDEYKANQKAEKEAQVKFEKEQWDKYNKMSFGEKVLDRTNAALNQPLLMAANVLMGDQAYIPGMAEGLGEEGPDYDKWLKATGQERGLGVNDVFSAWNPGNWGGHAGREYGEGNYVQGAVELGLGLLGLKGAPLMGNQLAKSSANKLINLEQKTGQALATPKNLVNNLSKSKNIKQAVGSLAGIPPEGALPRMSSDELKTFRKIQEIGRMRSKITPLSEQYEYALKQGIPDEHVQQVFGKSKEEIENAIPRLQEEEAIRKATPISGRIDLTRRPTEGVVTNDFRRITAESTPEEIANFANHMNMPVDQLTAMIARAQDTYRSNIIRHTLEDSVDTSRLQSLSDEDIAHYNNATGPSRRNMRHYVNDTDLSRRFSSQNKNWNDQDIKNRLINFSSAYPMYKGNVSQNVPSLSLKGSGSLKNVSDKVASESTANIKSGDVFTGSLNTSHSSYLPQLKQTFKYTEGAPQFVGYQPMNQLGFLSDFNYSNEDIAKYLNTEIDEQIKRGVVPKDILRPYIKHNKPNRILLPHYGIKQFEEGGSLELELTPDEIQNYIDAGYVVEELPKAQLGMTKTKYNFGISEAYADKQVNNLKNNTPIKESKKVVPVPNLKLPNWMQEAMNKEDIARSEYVMPIKSNTPIGIPASARNINTQPIQNSFASNFTNTGIPGQIDHKKLANNEAKKLNTKGMKEVEQASTFMKIMQNIGDAQLAHPDLEQMSDYDQYLNRYLEKKGLINPVEFKLKSKNIKTPEGVKTYYQELGTVQDNRSTNPTDSLLSYRNQFDAKKGFTYITAPVKKDRTNKEVYNNVEGVGHFILDASPNFEHPYIHANNFAYLRDAITRNDFIPIYESTGTKGEAKLTYKRAKDIDQKILDKIIEASGKISSTKSETERQNIANEVTPFLYGQKTKVISPLRQMKFDEIKFDQTQPAKGFANANEVKKANGEGTYLIFKDRDAYSRFSGGSVTFLFKDKKGNLIAREFAGTLNNIENEGISIKKEFGLKPNELTLGYNDVGSFSAKPKAKNNILSSEQWNGFNDENPTGGALIIPKQKR